MILYLIITSAFVALLYAAYWYGRLSSQRGATWEESEELEDIINMAIQDYYRGKGEDFNTDSR